MRQGSLHAKVDIAVHSRVGYSCSFDTAQRPRVGQSDVPLWAGVAQLVEHLICNQRVGGSSPFASSSLFMASIWAQVAERLMAADCKSATLRVTEVRILPCAPLLSFVIRAERLTGASETMDFSPSGTGRLLVALALFVVLALAAWFSMEVGKPRSLTLVLLAFFALRTLLARARSR